MNKFKIVIGLFAICHLFYSCANFNPAVEDALKWRSYKKSYNDEYGCYRLVEKFPLPYICVENQKLPLYREVIYPDIGIKKHVLNKLINSNKIDHFYIAKQGEKLRDSKSNFMSYLSDEDDKVHNSNYILSKWSSRDNDSITLLLELTE